MFVFSFLTFVLLYFALFPSSFLMNYIPWNFIDKIVEDILTSPSMKKCVLFTHSILITIGVPENHTPDAEQLLISITAVIFTLISYWYWLGHNHAMKRSDLESKLTKVIYILSFLRIFLFDFLLLSLSI